MKHSVTRFLNYKLRSFTPVISLAFFLISCKKTRSDYTQDVYQQISISITNVNPDSYDSLNNYLKDTFDISFKFKNINPVSNANRDSLTWTPLNNYIPNYFGNEEMVHLKDNKETKIGFMLENNLDKYMFSPQPQYYFGHSKTLTCSIILWNGNSLDAINDSLSKNLTPLDDIAVSELWTTRITSRSTIGNTVLINGNYQSVITVGICPYPYTSVVTYKTYELNVNFKNLKWGFQ